MHRIAPASGIGNYFRSPILTAFILTLVVVLPISGVWAEERKAENEEARELRQLVERLKQRVEVLERQQSQQQGSSQNTRNPAISNTSSKESKAPINPFSSKKALPEPAKGKIKFSFGGQIVVEAVSNWPSNSTSSEFDLLPTGVPTGSGGENGQFLFSARETRLWFKSSAMTRYGIFKTLLEMDFKGSSGTERVNNSNNPRMRHGYAQLGSFTMGQTESTFANLLAWPDTIPDAIAYISNRQAQIRWSQKLDEDFSLQVSLENPETTLTDATGARITPADDRAPDMVMKGLWYGDRGSLALSGLLREIRSDGAVVGGVEDSEVGGALYISGKLKTSGSDNIRFGLAGGNALGRYASNNSFNDGSIDANGQIELHMLYLGILSYQYWLNDHWRIATIATHIQADNDLSRVPASTVEQAQSFHLRVSWLPLLRTNFSLEYVHARSKLESGVEGELNHLHFSALYRF
ncbi:MAG: hypothetical protein HOH38_10995 [Nitrospinaceae bacterium]|nr:hypothetical protein [Nitrospinaceae bacterium]